MRKITEFKSKRKGGEEFQLAQFLHENGYAPTIGTGHWEIVCRHERSGHEIWIHRATKGDLKRDVTALTEKVKATRIVIVDFDLGSIPMLNPWFVSATTEGIGMYHPESGWINAPHQGHPNRYRELVPLLNERYMSSEAGLMKACSKCGEIKPLSAYYRRPRSHRNPKDPYRNLCKDCHRGR